MALDFESAGDVKGWEGGVGRGARARWVLWERMSCLEMEISMSI